MSIKVVISKRRARRLAAATVNFTPELGWQLVVYAIVGEQVAPFGISYFPSEAAAITDANATCKTSEVDWIELRDDPAAYILEQAKSRWSPSTELKRWPKLGDRAK